MYLPRISIGMNLEDAETPALVVNLDAFEQNLRTMAREAARTGIDLRPHSKTHKCPTIGRKQIEAGAVGVCCQKVSEAEAMANGGVDDILLTNEVVALCKIERLCALRKNARVAVCVDHSANVADIAFEARRYGIILPLLVELDLGMGRCGVSPGIAAAELAKRIELADSVRFAGLQAYCGKAQHIVPFEKRRDAIRNAADAVRHTINLLTRSGIECPTVTGGGTGTFPFEIESGLWTEIQPGSYIFMDREYLSIEDVAEEPFQDFEESLFIHTQVISRPKPDRIVLDAGLKALTAEKGLPEVFGRPELTCTGLSDEHCILETERPEDAPQIGDKLLLVPSHCDPTVNLHETFLGVRNGLIEALWPITGRGPGW